MLKKFFKSFKCGNKGFTLIELLVVIAILGVLAAVAIPNVGKFIGKSKVVAANTEFANVQTAMAAYQADDSATAPSGENVEEYIVPYMQSTLTNSYTVTTGANGKLVYEGTSVPATGSGIIWNQANQKWE